LALQRLQLLLVVCSGGEHSAFVDSVLTEVVVWVGTAALGVAAVGVAVGLDAKAVFFAVMMMAAASATAALLLGSKGSRRNSTGVARPAAKIQASCAVS